MEVEISARIRTNHTRPTWFHVERFNISTRQGRGTREQREEEQGGHEPLCGTKGERNEGRRDRGEEGESSPFHSQAHSGCCQVTGVELRQNANIKYLNTIPCQFLNS